MDKLLRRDDPLLQPRIQDMLNPPSKWRLFLRSAGAVLGAWILVSLAAWLSSLPLTAHHFHRLALWGWLSNVPVMPFVGIVEVLGLAKTAMAQVLPGTAALLGWPLAWATDGLLATVRFLARMPGAGMNIPAMPGWLVAAAMTLLGLWVVAPTMRIRHRVPALMAMGIAVVTTLWLCYPFHENACVIRVFSVGDGLATLVELPNGHVMVCDAGCRPPRDIEKRILGPFLARRAIRRIDTAVISHPNLDHYSALPDLTEHHSLKRFFTSPHFTLEGSKSGTAARLLDEMQTLSLRHHEVVKGDRLTGTGEVSIEVLWPPPCREMVIRESNNTSLVLRLTYAGKRILFCGDIEQMAQEHLLAMGDLKVDVMILPHHGSAKTTLPAFIAATNPEYCIRSSGQPDVESHPGLFRLMEGRRYFNTADDGAVEVRMTPAGLSVRPWLDRSNQRRGNQRMIMPAEPGPSEKFPLRPEIE